MAHFLTIFLAAFTDSDDDEEDDDTEDDEDDDLYLTSHDLDALGVLLACGPNEDNELVRLLFFLKILNFCWSNFLTLSGWRI